MEAESVELVVAESAVAEAPATEGEWHRVGEANILDVSEGERLHVQLEGRYISVIRHADKLYCLDSICFHAGGPLGLGEIEDLAVSSTQSSPCLVCPWHFYHVVLETGEKFYQGTQMGDNGKLVAGEWKSVGQRQRTHAVERRDDGLYVRLSTGGQLASDEYAYKHECGSRVKAGHLRLSPLHTHGDRDASPGRRSASLRHTPPSSPRFAGEGEDVWPEDLTLRDVAASQHAGAPSFCEPGGSDNSTR